MRQSSMLLLLAILVDVIQPIDSFAPSLYRSSFWQRQFVSANEQISVLSAKRKGFAKPSSAESTKKKKKPSIREEASTTPSVPKAQVSVATTSSSSTTTTTTTTTATSPPPVNAGQRLLEQMRREQAEKKDAELRKVRELLETDQLVQQTPAAIPEKVAERIGKRMLPFVGVPFFLGIGSFVLFWYSATYRNIEYEPSLVAVTTIALLVAGLLGITYSVMSASWDPDREGSFGGWDEFQTNLGNVREGLGRSKENAILRERLSGLSQDEIDSALADLKRRETTDAKRQQILESKLQDELK